MKKNIALVTGGYTGEAVISYQSAENVLSQLDPTLFNVYKIDINAQGWEYVDANGQAQQVDKSDFSIRVDGQKLVFDKAFMCIHGSPGEDGRLPAYFEMIGLPYTGCNPSVAALTMNKYHTVLVAAAAGIHTAPSYLAIKGTQLDIDKILALPYPVIVKPNDQGSSIGMSKVNAADRQSVQAALDKAFEVSGQVLVESFIPGREFTIGVMRDAAGIINTLPMTEIILKKGRELFDFEAKYNGETAEVTPAEASSEITAQIAEAAKKAYIALGCKGIVRIDFIYHKEQTVPYLLEINTVPGQTKESLIPKQVAAKGWTLRDFYTELLLAK